MRSKKVWFLVLVCSGVALSPVFDLSSLRGGIVDVEIQMPYEANTGLLRSTRNDEMAITPDLYSKVLLTAEEKARLQVELSNPDLIRKSYLLLTQTDTHERERFQALDYFEKAIAWQDNPAREQVTESLRNMMLLDNLASIEDIALRKSYAGDKIEAFALLKQYAPEELEVINTLPEDGRIRKLLAYAENLTH